MNENSKFSIQIQGDFKGNVGDGSTYNDYGQHPNKPARPRALRPTTPTVNTPAQRQCRKRYDVFLSYSRRNLNEARYVVRALRGEGLRVWMDERSIQPGSTWEDELNRGLRCSRCMVLCVSEDALRSRWVKNEYRYFLNKNKPLFPLVLDARRIPDFPAELAAKQYVVMDDLDRLLDAVWDVCRR